MLAQGPILNWAGPGNTQQYNTSESLLANFPADAAATADKTDTE